MAWEVIHLNEGVEPLLANMLAYFSAHQREALNAVQGDVSIPDFSQMYASSGGNDYTTIEQGPILEISESETEDKEAGDSSRLEVTHRFTFNLGVTDSVVATLDKKKFRLVKAIKQMLRKMTNTDWTAGMTSANWAKVRGVVVRYDRGLYQTKSSYMRAATVAVEIEMREMRNG